jgi:hypothetical protein
MTPLRRLFFGIHLRKLKFTSKASLMTGMTDPAKPHSFISSEPITVEHSLVLRYGVELF